MTDYLKCIIIFVVASVRTNQSESSYKIFNSVNYCYIQQKLDKIEINF